MNNKFDSTRSLLTGFTSLSRAGNKLSSMAVQGITLGLILGSLAAIVGAQDRVTKIRLFDGRSLTGWTGNRERFRVEDGAIVGGSLVEKIPNNFFLTHDDEFADFELQLKFKLIGDSTNAGIQIRSRRIPDHHEMIGYQADLGQKYWGCLYDESRRRKILTGPDLEKLKAVLKPGDWNDYRIRCAGRRIQLWINDFQTVDYTEDDDSIEQTGIIGLQIHGGEPGEAWYKDIIITRL